jgi:hypothetical protein
MPIRAAAANGFEENQGDWLAGQRLRRGRKRPLN